MDNNENFIDYNQAQSPQEERPTLLTVLCILTFIGSGLTILSSLMNLIITPSTNVEELESAVDQLEEGSFLHSFMASSMESMEYIFEFSVAGLLGSALCLFGAIKMWNLSKQGFYIYSVGAVISPVMILALMGGIMGISSIIFPAIMIGLYAINLKYMHD